MTQTIRLFLLLEGASFVLAGLVHSGVLVHGYEQWGEALPERIHGMFAFAIWDARRKRLFLARDRLGKKPVYYHLGRDRLVFGSEVKSLLCDASVPRELDEEALDLYLSLRYVPAGLTAFSRIHKLPPASCAVYEDGKLSVRRYWRCVFPPEPDSRSDDELSRRLTHIFTLDEAGHRRVKIVVSGGFDADRIRRFEAANVPVDAYGVGSSLLRGQNDFTADIVLVDGRECSKVGRRHRPNTRLEVVE